MTEISTMYYASKMLTQHFACIVHGRYLCHFCTVLNENKCVRAARMRRTKIYKENAIVGCIS